MTDILLDDVMPCLNLIGQNEDNHFMTSSVTGQAFSIDYHQINDIKLQLIYFKVRRSNKKDQK